MSDEAVIEKDVFCANCGLTITRLSEVVDSRRDWRHVSTASIFCKKKRGMTLTEAQPGIPESQHRSAGESEGNMVCDGCGKPVYDAGQVYGYSHCDTTLNVECDARPASKPVATSSGKGFEVTDEDRRVAVRLCNSGGVLICGVIAERRVAELIAKERAALSAAPAPEITWRVDVLGRSSDKAQPHWIDWNDGDYKDEQLARDEYARACAHSGWENARLVKIETTETIVSVRRRED